MKTSTPNTKAINRCRTAAQIGFAFVAMAIATPARAQTGDAVKDQHALIGVDSQHAAAGHFDASKLRWFREAGLGMFIHWGISSVDATDDLSWAMMADPKSKPVALTPEAYFKLADQFNPQHYDPEKWLRAAKDAGFGYAVLTTRHHDGYALWPSAYGDFSTRTHLQGRDLVGEYVNACRKVGLKVGFYYSSPDWHYNRLYMSFGYGSKGTPDSPHLGLKHEPIQLPEKPAGFDDQFIDYVNGQLTELLTRYGKIDLLWFDGGAGPKVLSQDQIRALQPDILINDRQHGTGDFTTAFEVRFPKDAKERPNGLWEHCYSMTGGWGYQKQQKCAPAALLVSRLAKARAWGGNVLANFPPRSDGDFPEMVYQRLAEVKAWMDKHRESVIGVLPGPNPEQSNVPITIRDKTWYLHLLPKTEDGPAFDGPAVVHGVAKPKQVTLIGTGQSLAAQLDGDTLTIAVSKELRTSLVDVIAVIW